MFADIVMIAKFDASSVVAIGKLNETESNFEKKKKKKRK